jgi:prolyl oligopeptidase
MNTFGDYFFDCLLIQMVAAHSFKFIARMQYCQGCDAPVLARTETRASTGAGKQTAKQIEEVADQCAFLV